VPVWAVVPVSAMAPVWAVEQASADDMAWTPEARVRALHTS